MAGPAAEHATPGRRGDARGVGVGQNLEPFRHGTRVLLHEAGEPVAETRQEAPAQRDSLDTLHFDARARPPHESVTREGRYAVRRGASAVLIRRLPQRGEGEPVKVDYAYRYAKFFDGSNVFALTLGF